MMLVGLWPLFLEFSPRKQFRGIKRRGTRALFNPRTQAHRRRISQPGGADALVPRLVLVPPLAAAP